MEKLRISSYVIPIKLEDEINKYMLMHGYTGAIDIVGEEVVTKLLHHQGQFIDLTSFDEEIGEYLIKRGYLTTKSENEEYEYVKRLASALHKKKKIVNSSFTFVVTYNCNFKCPYCFEKEAIQNIHKTITFTKEMVDKAYLLIQEIQPDNELRPGVITLFGGEPLLKENKEIVRYIIEQGRALGFRFDAVTNGYDLDAYEDLLSSENFNHLLITVDGTEERHNSTRIHKKNSSTFDIVIKNIGIALNGGVGVTVRVNTDKSNIQELNDLKSLFDSLHYTDNSNFFMDSAMLRNYDKKITDEQKKYFFTTREFVEEHKKLKFKYGCNSFGVFSNIFHAIIKQKPLQYRSTFCGAQAGGYVFDPLGKIYTCWEAAGKKEFEVGDYLHLPVTWNYETLNLWQNHNITSVQSCSICKYALLCGGGCLAVNWDKHKCNNMPELIEYAANTAFNNYKFKEYENRNI